MAHFVVENELGIAGGIFGQLAGGGHARTFQPTDEQAKRKVAKRGKRIAATNRGDAMLSEKVVYLACRTWNNGLSAMPAFEVVSAEDIRRVCREFDAVSAIWSKLAVGESMTLVWAGSSARTGRRRPRRR
jgi:hypothetical protein